MSETVGRSRGTDYFKIAEQLTPAERAVWDRVRRFVDDEVLPVINDYWERAEFPTPLVERLGELGVVGDGIQGYGCPDLSPMAAGLVHLELNRGDGSLGTFVGVQAGLAMWSIALLGSEEQKQRWLPCGRSGRPRSGSTGSASRTAGAPGRSWWTTCWRTAAAAPPGAATCTSSSAGRAGPARPADRPVPPRRPAALTRGGPGTRVGSRPPLPSRTA